MNFDFVSHRRRKKEKNKTTWKTSTCLYSLKDFVSHGHVTEHPRTVRADVAKCGGGMTFFSKNKKMCLYISGDCGIGVSFFPHQMNDYKKVALEIVSTSLTRSYKDECSTSDQTIILSLQIFFDHRSLSSIGQKIFIMPRVFVAILF